MLLTIKKQTEVTVNVEIPMFRVIYGSSFYKITEEAIVYVTKKMVWVTPKDDMFYKDDLKKAVQEGNECSEAEFDQAYYDAMTKIMAVNPLPITTNH